MGENMDYGFFSNLGLRLINLHSPLLGVGAMLASFLMVIACAKWVHHRAHQRALKCLKEYCWATIRPADFRQQASKYAKQCGHFVFCFGVALIAGACATAIRVYPDTGLALIGWEVPTLLSCVYAVLSGYFRYESSCSWYDFALLETRCADMEEAVEQADKPGGLLEKALQKQK